MADGVWKGVQVIGHSAQLSLNKFFDPSTPSMRKGDDGEKKNGGEKIMMKIVATNVVASRPPERRPTATATARAPTPPRNRIDLLGLTASLLAGSSAKFP